jgi:presenilin-like A22 family membrane protease
MRDSESNESEFNTEDPQAKLRAFIIPIIFVISVAILLSVFTIDFYKMIQATDPDFTPPDISPIPESSEDPGGIAYGALLNMVFYVMLAFIGGVVVLVVVRKGFVQLLAFFFAALMGFSWFVFGLFYGDVVIFSVLNLFWDIFPLFIQQRIDSFFNWTVTIGTQNLYVFHIMLYLFAIGLGLLGTISFGIQTFEKIWIKNVMMVFFGAMIGSMLAIHLGLLTTLLILIGLSIYDIFAVFRGPLKGIIDHGRKTAEEFEKNIEISKEGEIEYEKVPLLPALPVYSTPLINIGLGDFAFFSMLVSAVVVISDSLVNSIPLIATLLGLFLGAYYTFKFLEKERALPGLPLPIFGGLGFLTISILIGLILGFFSLNSIYDLFI